MSTFSAAPNPLFGRALHLQRFARVILGLILLLAAGPLVRADNTFVVDSIADDGSPGTLRWAIEQANSAGTGTQTISIQFAESQTISLASNLPMLNNVAGSIVIENAGSQAVTINGQDSYQVFFVAAGNVSISDVAIVNGAAQGGTGGAGIGGGGGALGAGGALFVNDGATVVIQNVQFDGNSAAGGTGGLNDNNLAGGGGGAGFTAGATGGNATGLDGGGGGGAGFAGPGGDGASGGGGGGGLLGAGGAGMTGGGGGGGLTAGSTATLAGGDGNSGALGGTAGTASNTSATAGNGGDGQSPLTGGGGGGGQGGTNSSTGFAGNGGAGGGGGFGGGGGGGGAGGVSTADSYYNGNGGSGGNGGTYGGGGGGGNSHGGDFNGGNGGDFGGGGGAPSIDFEQQFSPSGGNGGFGGGGGGASDAMNSSGGSGGFGGGQGGNRYQSGSGGSGYGGAIFVRQGGALTIISSSTANSSVTAGSAGAGQYHGHVGDAAGQDLYLMSGVNVTLDQAGSSFSGSISGEGGLILQGTGATFLSGANDYSGGTTVGGTTALQGTTTSIQGTITNNSIVAFDQSFDGTYTGNMSGSGSLYFSGTGTVELTGITNLGGTTKVMAGGLAMNGVLTSETVVEAGAMLSGNGTIVGDVTINGEMAPGNSIDTFIVNGGYIQNAGSTLTIEINDDGTTPGVHNDLLSVDAATLNGGTVVVDAAPGTYASNPYRFLRSVTALQGSFASVTSSLTDYNIILGYDYFDSYYWAYLLLEPTVPDYVQFATTLNEWNVAGYLDSVYNDPNADLQTMFDGLNTLRGDPAAMQHAFNAMSDQVSPTLAQVGIQNTTLVVQQLAGQLRSGNFLAEPAYAKAGAAPAAKSRSPIMLVSYDRRSATPQVTFVSQEDCDCWQGWSFGYGLGGSAKSDGNAAGLNYGMGGMLLGAERYFHPAGRVGFFAGYQGTSLQLDGLTQNGRVNGGMVGSYFHNDDGFGYCTAITGMQISGYDTTRYIQFDGINETASGSFSGWQGYGYLERGVSLRHTYATFQPYGALQYIYLRQNGYTETGAGVLNLDVGGIDANSLRGLVGSRLQLDRGCYGGRLLPELRALWLHEFLDTNSVVNSFFAPIGGGSFAIQGVDLGRDWAIVGGGVRYELASGWQLYGNYDAQVNTQQVFHVGSGGLQYAW